jgi:hypothetical protein
VRTGKSLRRLVDESLAINGIPVAVFLGWVQQLEFDLQESPKEKLKFIPNDGYYEKVETHHVEGRRFTVIWELELDADWITVLDVSIVQLSPDISRNHG